MVLLCFLIANGRNINKHKTVAVLGSGFFCVGEWLLSQSHNYIWLNHQFSFKSLGKFYVMLQNQRVVIKKNYSNVLIAMRVEEGLLKPPNRGYFFQSKSWLLYCLLDFSQKNCQETGRATYVDTCFLYLLGQHHVGTWWGLTKRKISLC